MTVGDVPPSLRRPGRPDRLLTGYRFAMGAYAALAARARTRAVTEVDRDLALVVARRDRLADDVVAVRFESADGTALPPWSPGAHLDVVLPSGTLRQYSLCGDPADRGGYRIAVRRIADGGGGSIAVHDALPVGAAVTGRGPRNAFPFAYPHLARRDIARVHFLAAGIGITAIWPMVRAAVAAGVDWRLVYVGRSPLPFADEIAALDPARVRVHTGTRLSAAEMLGGVDAGTSVYFCGPPGLLADVRADVDGRPCAGFHFERFSPPPVVGGSVFTLRLARSGRTVAVAADRSALSAAREAVPGVPYSCQQGFCGTCRVRVLAGQVQRRGSATFLDAPDTMLTCVDRAVGGEITVDL